MADADLPVFSFEPNWVNGVTEYLEWLTDVLGSMTGFEQRRAVRITPRRFFEATFNPVGQKRSFMDLWMARFAEQEFLMPLWHDKARIAAAVTAGDLRLDFDNTYREFLSDGLGLLYFDAFSWEVVEIAGQDDAGLDLAAALGADWPVGTVLYPLRPAYLDDPEGSMEALSTRVGDVQLDFRVSRDNGLDLEAETLTLFNGYPVVTLEPNRADNRTVQYARLFEDSDNRIGRLFRRDEAGRAFTTQFYNWQAKGRAAHHDLRQALYRLQGRQKAVWMPSFNEDVVLARDLAAGSNRLDIRQIGYRYLGGPVGGRDYITLDDDTGTRRIVNVTGTSVPLAPGEDRLNLSAVAGFAAKAGRSGSFVQLVRLDQDRVEITHHTDSDGVCEVSAAFKSFAAGRATAGPLVLPYPVAEQGGEGCGYPAEGEESDCLILPPVFEGWYARGIYNCPTLNMPAWIARPNVGAGVNNSQGTLYEATPDGGRTVTIYFYDPAVMDATDFRLQLQYGAGAWPGVQFHYGTFSFQKWNEAFGGTLTPYAGDDLGNPFRLYKIFPVNYYFHLL